MESEKQLGGISARIADKADTKLRTSLETAVTKIEATMLINDAYHLSVIVPRKSSGWGELTVTPADVTIPARLFFRYLKDAAFDALRDRNRADAFRAFMAKFDELQQSIEEISAVR
jgi:hypothetical protein